MGLRSPPKWNVLSKVTRIGIVSSWILLYVFWGAVAVLPFGFDVKSPAIWSVGGMLGIILLSRLWMWFSPAKVRYFDEDGCPDDDSQAAS
ncbi:MAG: hypothetical protein GY822_17315 [Deltaproteobacteria bacterium]|nr:hypothetical protein [Deltaproteobacteria bacterium]